MDILKQVKHIYKTKYGFENNLNMLHTILNSNQVSENDKMFYNTVPIFGKTDRKSCFVKDFYNYYDSSEVFNNLYIDYINKYIKPLFNETKLVVQKTPNLRVHIPNNSNIGKRNNDPNENIIGVHCDSEFGHPTSEINFILAITEMFDTNSIYFEPKPNSGIKYSEYNNIKLKPIELWYGNLNQCKHYNMINKTNKTRISLDFRVIPYSLFKPSNSSSATSNKKFTIGDYYIIV